MSQSLIFHKIRYGSKTSLFKYERPTANSKTHARLLRSGCLGEAANSNMRPSSPLMPPPVTYILPHFFPDDQYDGIPRITPDTISHVLDGKYGEHFEQQLIVDCRFGYEYSGGHITGATNYCDKDQLAQYLFESLPGGRTLLIFHCEHSIYRAPMVARHIRAKDRQTNEVCYPTLTYPEVYILDGGYYAFYEKYRTRCKPQGYVQMAAEEHREDCDRELGRLRQKHKGFVRKLRQQSQNPNCGTIYKTLKLRNKYNWRARVLAREVVIPG